MKGQDAKRLAGVLCSAQRWLISISSEMTSALSEKGGFELRGVVKLLAFYFGRHLALLALCHLFSRQATRKSDIVFQRPGKVSSKALEKYSPLFSLSCECSA
jgi:hypothetical protein